ncbi:hypothetical protein GEV43_30525 [Actinomadura sp. J1-007]|nr:hypothetical protein [Actinomadura sp. J1-007]
MAQTCRCHQVDGRKRRQWRSSERRTGGTPDLRGSPRDAIAIPPPSETPPPSPDLARLRRGAAAVLLAAVPVTVAVPRALAGEGGDRTTDLIIEFAAAPAATAATAPAGLRAAAARQAVAERRGTLRAGQRDLLAKARSRGVRLTEKRSFTLLFNGVAVRARERDRAALASLPGVAAVHPDLTMRRADTASNELTGVPGVWKRKAPDGRGTRGDGTTVAVVDTGIDYRHPDLGGGSGRAARSRPGTTSSTATATRGTTTGTARTSPGSSRATAGSRAWRPRPGWPPTRCWTDGGRARSRPSSPGWRPPPTPPPRTPPT